MQKLIDSGKTEDALVMMFREVVNMPEEEIHLLRTQPSWKKRVTNANTAAREIGESPSRELANAQVVASALTKSRIQILAGQQHAAMYTSPDLFVKELRNPYARSTDIMPVRNIASNVPAPPIETTGTPRSGIFFKLSKSIPIRHPRVPEI